MAFYYYMNNNCGKVTSQIDCNLHLLKIYYFCKFVYYYYNEMVSVIFQVSQY